MNSDDIEETNNVAVSNNQPGSSQLVVRGGTVILPERCRCRPGDAVFDAQLEAILPDDIGPVLLRQMADQHRHPQPESSGKRCGAQEKTRTTARPVAMQSAGQSLDARGRQRQKQPTG